MTELATTDLTEAEARTLTEAIRGRVVDLLPLITQAYERRADRALGYDSWSAYCAEELSGLRLPLADRPAMVAELRQTGMSTRAIGAALGVGKSTVDRDLATVPGGTVEPTRITSLDGRERPATMPARQDVADTTLKGVDAHVSTPAVTAVVDAPDVDLQLAAKAAVAEAMARHLPPDPDAAHHEWRINFLGAIRPATKLMAGFTVDSVVRHADEECVEELGRLAREISSYYDRVRSARPVPNNVRHLRAVS